MKELRISKFKLLIIILSFFISLAASIFIYNSEVPREGLEYIFVLPLLAVICVVPVIIKYNRSDSNIVLYVFYFFYFIRYIILPIVMTISNGALHYQQMQCTPYEYRMSLIIMILEMIAISIGILVGMSIYDKKNNYFKDCSSTSFVSKVVVFLLILLCIIRYDRFINTMSFLSISDDIENIGSYEAIILNVLTIFIFTRFLVYAHKKYICTGNRIWIVLSGIVGFISVFLYFGINRSLIVQKVIAAIIILIIYFPSIKKIIIIIMIPILVIVILSISSLRHVNTNMDGTVKDEYDIAYISRNLETYINGPWVIASAMDVFNKYEHNADLNNLITDFVVNFFPFLLPGLDNIRNYYLTQDGTTDIYNNSTGNKGYMVPMVGQCIFYFGDTIGIFVDIIIYVFFGILMQYFSYKVRITKYAELQFYYLWLMILFSMCMSYCLITYLWSWSKFGLILLFISKSNKIRYKKLY